MSREDALDVDDKRRGRSITWSRRAMVGGAAVAVPAIVLTATTPALAASVSPAPVTVTVSANPSSVATGRSTTISGTVSGGAAKGVGQSVVLSSSDAKVILARTTLTTDASGHFSTTATVSGSAGSGTASITATSGGASASTAVSYAPEAVTSVSISANPSMLTRDSATTVSGNVSGASGGLPGRTVSLSSSDGSVTFSNASPVTDGSGNYATDAVISASSSAQSATFTASSGGKSASTSITITSTASSIAITNSIQGTKASSVESASVDTASVDPSAINLDAFRYNYIFQGVVKDANGTPVAYRRVSGVDSRGNPWKNPPAQYGSLVTDANGAFGAAGVSSNIKAAYSLTFTCDGATFSR